MNHGVLNFTITSAKGRMQDINFNQLNLKVTDTCRENQKLTTNFEALKEENVTKKAYIDRKLSKIEG